ncbi:Kinesin-like protein KIN-UB [Vitis vinifera]|uniref:Vacuolar protein 8 n=1 Tax=Vitis vinifera TaxID=29760 RepID=A0A438IWB8_VITVI|nr:Kinesin-like protein KIN-UB [Vitis vinifera]
MLMSATVCAGGLSVVKSERWKGVGAYAFPILFSLSSSSDARVADMWEVEKNRGGHHSELGNSFVSQNELCMRIRADDKRNQLIKLGCPGTQEGLLLEWCLVVQKAFSGLGNEVGLGQCGASHCGLRLCKGRTPENFDDFLRNLGFTMLNNNSGWWKLGPGVSGAEELAEAGGNSEILKLRKSLEDEAHKKKKLEEEITILQSQLLQLTFEADRMRRCLERGGSGNAFTGLDSLMSQVGHLHLKDAGNGQRASIATLSEQVGLQKVLSLLESEDANVRIHAVKVVANLAAEEANQEKIVEAGGLSSLLMLLRRFEDETVRRVAAGAIANLAMNEANQELIMVEGGISLLSMTAAEAEDPQTLRMVAGAIANLCGNDKLQMKLRSEGGIKALLGTVRCGIQMFSLKLHVELRTLQNASLEHLVKVSHLCGPATNLLPLSTGTKTGRSFLIEDGALQWIVQNANNEASPIRRHIELALCHLAQHEVNAKDMISGGALWELVRISRDCSREDIRNLAHRTLTSSPTFRSELRRLRIEF